MCRIVLLFKKVIMEMIIPLSNIFLKIHPLALNSKTSMVLILASLYYPKCY